MSERVDIPLAAGDDSQNIIQPGPRMLTHIFTVITRDPLSLLASVVIVLSLLAALLAPLIAPHPDQGSGKSHVSTILQAPSAQFPLGTDELGRDIVSRILMGAQSALLIPILVVLGAVLIGVPLGALAGYKGGWVDEVIMRITDMFLAFPSLLLAMAIAAALGRGLVYAAIALIVSWWPWYTRLVRSVAAGLKKQYFVEAARAIGVPDRLIIWRHILPNCISPILVQATIDMGTVVLAMAGLAFIGLGTQRPAPDWGLMVSDGRSYLLAQWWLSTFPGVAIFIVVLAFNIVGDTLRDIFDPRQYR